MAKLEKKISIFGGLIGLGIVALIFLTVHTTNQLKTSAGEFLALVGQGQFEQAIEIAAGNFQEIISVEQLENLLTEVPEFDTENVKWTDHKIQKTEDGTEAVLYGVSQTEEGELTIKLFLKKEEGEWKVMGVFFPEIGWEQTSFLEESANAIPPEGEEIFVLAKKTLDLLTAGIDSGDYTALYKAAAEPVKITSSPGKFKEVFDAFVDVNPEFADASVMQIEVDEKLAVAENGVITITGRFISEDEKYEFEIEYGFTEGEWKMFHASVKEPVAEAL